MVGFFASYPHSNPVRVVLLHYSKVYCMPFPPYVPDHTFSSGPSIGTAVAFTSEAEIQRVLSYKGQLLHLDDLDSGDSNYHVDSHVDATDDNYLTEVIQRVTSKIMSYLAPRFSAEVLYQIPRIREIATYWAAHDISRRRGNEPLYETEVAEALEELERYREGSLYLDAPSVGPRTYVQAYVTDSRYFRNPTRVITSASTKVISGQRRAWEYPFFWL